uniref:ORF4b n=1 Tax=Middle East respiratory syndrome-related coronavirus TaxID=1335626 RepID=A0A2P1ITB1_MERS|nr:ORF4b [Middle East respiratory syndrome-related coronavirus]
MEESLMDVPSTSGTQVYSHKARKRSHSPTKKLRYVKRRFSLLRPEDLSVIVQPTHYVRVTFSDPNIYFRVIIYTQFTIGLMAANLFLSTILL